MPAWDKEIVIADIKVEAEISALLPPHVEALIAKARAIADQLTPFKVALSALLHDVGPQTHDPDTYIAFEKGRKPLADAKAAAQAFFDDTRQWAMPSINV
jgi:hypothetical protein